MELTPLLLAVPDAPAAPPAVADDVEADVLNRVAPEILCLGNVP